MEQSIHDILDFANLDTKWWKQNCFNVVANVFETNFVLSNSKKTGTLLKKLWVYEANAIQVPTVQK